MVSGTEQPLVSIITPCYNGEKFVRRFLDSILNQTYSNIELIFINDGSTDNTEQIVLAYTERFKSNNIDFKYIYQENKGQASALNRGLEIFKGKYLGWVDCDDILLSDSINRRVQFLENHRDFGMVRSNGIFINEECTRKLGRISNKRNRFNHDIFEDLILERTYCSNCCYLVRSDVFFQIYPNRKIYESKEGQNWQLLVPISSIAKCGYIDEDLCYIVVRKNSHSLKERNYNEKLSRIDGLEEILLEALKHSKCDYNN